MAARVHAVAQHSSYWILVYSLLIVYVSLSITYAQTHIQEYVKYSRDELIIIGLIPGDCIFNQEVPTHEIPSLDFRVSVDYAPSREATKAVQREETEVRLHFVFTLITAGAQAP